MYKDFGADEKVVLIFTAVFSIGYRICRDYKICDINTKNRNNSSYYFSRISVV